MVPYKAPHLLRLVPAEAKQLLLVAQVCYARFSLQISAEKEFCQSFLLILIAF